MRISKNDVKVQRVYGGGIGVHKCLVGVRSVFQNILASRSSVSLPYFPTFRSKRLYYCYIYSYLNLPTLYTLCSMVRLYTHKLGFSQYEFEQNEWIEIMFFFWIFESLEMWCDFTERRKIGQKLLSLTKMSRRHNFLGSRLKKQKCTEEVIWLGFLASLETSPTTYPKIKKSLFCYLV